MNSIRYYFNLIESKKNIYEASYDPMIASMKAKAPESAPAIDWAKTLKRQDRVVWYLNIIKKLIANPNDRGTLGGEASLEQFQEKLIHFLDQEIPKIQAYQFKQQPANEVFDQLGAIEQEYQSAQIKTQPVQAQSGDKELFKFNDGSAWWFIDRAFCPDEGRSGAHCGNVTGQKKTDQRILSYRINGHVQLTFILEPNGFLGEMKAKGNLKPAPKYHSHIMTLLLSPIVKGIQGAGYLPEANFSVFDLDERNLNIIAQQRPSFIPEQIQATPMEFMNAPAWVRSNPEYRRIAIGKIPGVAALIDTSGELNTSVDVWDVAIKKSPDTIVYAPSNLPDFQNRVIGAIARTPRLLMQAPRSIRLNFDILKSVVIKNSSALTYVAPTTPKYREICKIAITNDFRVLEYVPEELRDRDLCKFAVTNNGNAL